MKKIYHSYNPSQVKDANSNSNYNNNGKINKDNNEDNFGDKNEESKKEEKKVITPSRYEKPLPQTKFLEFDEAR